MTSNIIPFIGLKDETEHELYSLTLVLKYFFKESIAITLLLDVSFQGGSLLVIWLNFHEENWP